MKNAGLASAPKTLRTVRRSSRDTEPAMSPENVEIVRRWWAACPTQAPADLKEVMPSPSDRFRPM
jgi:hypothetical protein